MTKQQIDCEQALRQIYEFLDRELGEDDHEAMQHHLHTCKSCFSRFEFEQRLKQKVTGLREESASAGISDRVKNLLKSF